jgi:hypothetical protein
VWLPRRLGEHPTIRLYPQRRSADVVETLRGPFALAGRISGFAAGDVIAVRADEVWSPRSSTRSLGSGRSETVVEADAVDLQVLERMPRGDRRRRRVRASTSYWITRCPAIVVGPALMDSYTGETTIEKTWEFEVTLGSGVDLKFEEIYRYEEQEGGTLRYSELIARDDREILSRDFGRVDHPLLDEIDDFLALVSFASRYRSACVGFDASTDGFFQRFRYYRGYITVPPQEDWDSNFAVIDLVDFKDFVQVAYASFIATGPHELLRHALHLVVPRAERTVESSFTSLYAALETIVLWYRQQKGLVHIIEGDDDWKRLSDDTRRYLKNHELLQGNDSRQKEKRKMISAKVEELRRVPFRTAFEQFCAEYSVNLDDLWPVHDRLPEISLTEIRNRIVHGRAFDPLQFTALIDAQEHIRWTVERALLGALRWPVARSKVRPDFLKHFTAMTELREDRAAIK